MPYGMKPPCEPKLLPLNWVNSTMMARTGIATFHHVMPALILLNMRMAKKLSPVKIASSTTVIAKPSPVVTSVVVL